MDYSGSMKKSLHKTKTKQLKLAAQTVRKLSTTELDGVRGGYNGYTSACAKQTNWCGPCGSA